MHRKGRIEEAMDSNAAEYTASLKDDTKLFEAVVLINKAHLKMLGETGILKDSEVRKILEVLSELQQKDFEELHLRPELEDIHMVVEEYVKDKLGEEVGGKLHTAKSRNDQVATAIRFVLRDEILKVQELTVELADEVIKMAGENVETLMPGYTHLQVAEPTTFAHYLGNYIQAFIRDLERLSLSYEITNRCPMGSCAFAGTSFPIDRNLTSSLLGFDSLCENTMDATGSRDFALQAMADLSILMTNISRLSEELVLWSSAEFNMVEISGEFSSTSSIMPQKKNPVVAELERAKGGRTVGNLVGGFSIMKNLPQAYNLDLQELTPLLWDSVRQTKSSLKVMKGMFEKINPINENMRNNVERGYATLTELANTIVKESGISFRKAHEVVGKLSSLAVEEEKSLRELTVGDLKVASEKVMGEEIKISEEKFEKALDLNSCIENRNVEGGPSPESMKEELSKFEKRIDEYKEELCQKGDKQSKTREKLKSFPNGG